MRIPEKFEKILKDNQLLHGMVLDVITSFQPIYEDNKLFFFEEYTDHGIDHIEKVLASAEFIISDDSFKNLTAKDIAVFILSVILHDIGMHIEFSTFKSLINGKYDQCRLHVIDSKKWSELWREYLTEAKRFSSQQKKNIFGDEFLVYREPDLDNKDNLNGTDKKLIGEFIRRHHPRLAHEIAFNGLIGPKDQKVEFGNRKLKLFYRQMSGIVARSHGMNIRETFGYLREISNQGWRNPHDVNIIFLMVVLRIADYIQIEDDRTNEFTIKLKTFNSPISLKEHQFHLAIESISFNQPDNEKIFVSCNPANSEMLIKVKTLISDIQNELDVSWAILGEVYGFLSAKKPYIKFRRITSNLEDNLYLNKLKFVPQKIRFEVNNELSKLLVGPLYGNRPTFGVRELLQNSVDACIERSYLEKKNNNRYFPHIKINIDQIDENTSLFSIVDNGKGMTLDEIIHYFLNVGTSFRKSLSWRKQFTDDKGKSLINRNGKFGIGVLAAFLIGEKLAVKTKHLTEKIVYSFTTSIDSEFVDIKKTADSSIDPGTSISLVTTNDRIQELLNDEQKKWTDWYVNNTPLIEYYVDGEMIIPEILFEKDGTLSFNTKDFKNIKWKYAERNYRHHRFFDCMVVCNGIVITDDLDYHKNNFFVHDDAGNEKYVIESKPSFYFDDHDGLFPIKLDRNDIDCYELPFEKELYIEVAKDFIATILTLEIDVTKNITNIPSINHNYQLLFSKKGYSLDIDYFINLLKEDYSFIRVITTENKIDNHYLTFKNAIIYPIFNEKINLTYQEPNVAPRYGGIVLMRESNYAPLFTSSIKRLSIWAKQSHSVIFSKQGIVAYNFLHFNSKSNFLLNVKKGKRSKVAKDLVDKTIESVQEVDFRLFYRKGGEILNNLLTKYIGNNPIIPYSLTERRIKFQKAFRELQKFMKKNKRQLSPR